MHRREAMRIDERIGALSRTWLDVMGGFGIQKGWCGGPCQGLCSPRYLVHTLNQK